MSDPLETATNGPGVGPAQFLTFMLAGGTYGIDILCVREIIEHGPITSVPMMPPGICGVINLREAVVPVIDLKTRFGLPASEITKRSCIVIAEVGVGRGQTVGAVVDGVNEVLDIAAQDIEPPPHFGARAARYVNGMAKARGRFVILLDASQAMALDAFSEHGIDGHHAALDEVPAPLEFPA